MYYKATKIVAALIAVSFIAFINGCKSEEIDYRDSSPKAIKSADFNQENYVWENFLFPTNRTSGAK